MLFILTLHINDTQLIDGIDKTIKTNKRQKSSSNSGKTDVKNAKTRPPSAYETKFEAKTEHRNAFGNNLGNFDGILGQFWDALYMNRGFNSSFVLLLPLFTVTIPGYGRGIPYQSPLSALNIGNLAVFGIIVFGTIALWAPIIYPDLSVGYAGAQTGFRNFGNIENITEILSKRLLDLTEQILGRALNADNKQSKVNNFLLSRLHSLIDFLMSFADKLFDGLPDYPGLHPQECIKRCICESHKRPKHYGRIGQVIRLLFHPYRESIKSLKLVSKYRLAANYGLKDKTIDCEQRFNRCHLNFARLIDTAINFLF